MRKIGYLTLVEGRDSIVSVLLIDSKKKSGPTYGSVRVNSQDREEVIAA